MLEGTALMSSGGTMDRAQQANGGPTAPGGGMLQRARAAKEGTVGEPVLSEVLAASVSTSGAAPARSGMLERA